MCSNVFRSLVEDFYLGPCLIRKIQRELYIPISCFEIARAIGFDRTQTQYI
jgi:hypothetical protein